MHAPTEDKSYDTKDRFHVEIDHIFNQLLKYHMRIVSGDFDAKLRNKDTFKPTIRMRIYMKLVMKMGSSCTKKSNCQEYNVPTLQHS